MDISGRYLMKVFHTQEISIYTSRIIGKQERVRWYRVTPMPPAGIRLTRDSWNTNAITQKRPKCPPLEGRGFRGLKSLWHMVSRLTWISALLKQQSTVCAL